MSWETLADSYLDFSYLADIICFCNTEETLLVIKSVYIYNIYAYIIYIYTNLPVNPIVTLQHPRSGDSQGQETFLAPSADKQTRNYDPETSNHLHPQQH